jgi:predicted Rossmann fold flavoprotein
MRKTDLIVVGGGAAGLMAGCAAGEAGLKTVVLERKHKPGRKLLMCGNARCNLTTNIAAERMIQMFGEPVGPFLRTAIRAFDPSALQRWFAAQGLKTVTKAGNKVYPESEKAADVLNLFTDRLRDLEVTLAVSAVVQSIEKRKEGFWVEADNFALEAKHLLLATGGVSYPKSGSVGDGQQFAQRLGHSLEPYRAGLVGFEVAPQVIQGRQGTIYERVVVELLSKGRQVGETRGVYEIESWGVGGTALTDASRLAARLNLSDFSLKVHFSEGGEEVITPLRSRPIKEAMVTVGGVSLEEIDPSTMVSKICPGLYFAGEVMDVDGPTGGYNLQAAFSTARLAVDSIAKSCGRAGLTMPEKPVERRNDARRGREGRKGAAPSRRRRG